MTTVAEKVRDEVNNRIDYDTATIHQDYDVLNIKHGEFEAVIVENTSPQVDEAIVYYPEGFTSNVTDASIDEAAGCSPGLFSSCDREDDSITDTGKRRIVIESDYADNTYRYV